MVLISFLLLSLVSAAVIVYPLLPGQASGPAAPAVTDSDIDEAVGHLRRSRTASGHSCPTCGRTYVAGDRFCIGCGDPLPEPATVAASAACPECRAPLRDGDQYCAKCGHSLTGQGDA